ncbi:hypothetical protein DP42_4977 [Burkholderia pseudomallei]|nr:hypothetical protein DP42_4977 [Burkholderia pseudomallei]
MLLDKTKNNYMKTGYRRQPTGLIMPDRYNARTRTLLIIGLPYSWAGSNN